MHIQEVRVSVPRLLSENLRRGLATLVISGGFRNLERGVWPLAREARPKILGLPHPLSVT